MYERFFFLKERPFHVTPDPKFLYLGGSHGEAFDLLAYGIKERKGFILLSGEVGAGKTTLCRALLGALPKKTETALILNPVLSERDLVKAITDDFGIKVEGDGIKAHVDRLNSFLLNVAGRGGNAVVIIDEAQNLNPRTFEMLRLLSNLETEKEKLLQIVIAGQPELLKKLRRPELRQLNQRIAVRCHLKPLKLAETRCYITKRLSVAGSNGSVEFTDEAVAIIHARSRGIPRMVNLVCDRSLAAAYCDDRRTVDEKTVMKAVTELEAQGALPAPARKAPAYSRFFTQIAISAFFIAVIAGILWGPLVYTISSFGSTP